MSCTLFLNAFIMVRFKWLLNNLLDSRDDVSQIDVQQSLIIRLWLSITSVDLYMMNSQLESLRKERWHKGMASSKLDSVITCLISKASICKRLIMLGHFILIRWHIRLWEEIMPRRQALNLAFEKMRFSIDQRKFTSSKAVRNRP